MDTSILRSSLSKDNQLYEISNLKYAMRMQKEEKPINPPPGYPGAFRPYHGVESIARGTFTDKLDNNPIKTHRGVVDGLYASSFYNQFEAVIVNKKGSNVNVGFDAKQYDKHDDMDQLYQDVFRNPLVNRIKFGPFYVTYDPGSHNGGCNGIQLHVTGNNRYSSYISIYLDWIPEGETKCLILYQNPPNTESRELNITGHEYRVNTNPIF